MTKTPSKLGTVLIMTNSVEARKYKRQIREGAEDQKWGFGHIDFRNDVSPSEVLSKMRHHNRSELIGSGSPENIAQPEIEGELGKLEIKSESHLTRRIITLCMYLIIATTNGNHDIRFFGICYSAQAMAVALAAVSILKQAHNLKRIRNAAQLDRLLRRNKSFEKLMNDPLVKNMLAELETSATFIQEERVLPEAKDDPILADIVPEDSDRYDLLHSRNQTILRDTMEETRERLDGVVPVRIIAVRDGIKVYRPNGVESTQTVTLFRVGEVLYAAIGHPDYRTDTLANGYAKHYSKGAQHGSYFRPDDGGIYSMEELIQNLREQDEEPKGRLLLRNFFALDER